MLFFSSNFSALSFRSVSFSNGAPFSLEGQPHRLNRELDLQSLLGLHVHSCTHWLIPHNPHPPAFGLIYEGGIGQPRRHLLVTPWPPQTNESG
jgi:hypothetical protein